MAILCGQVSQFNGILGSKITLMGSLLIHEYRDLFGVPLFARLSKTFLNGCLDGVTKASTCESFISVKLKMLIQWIEYN